MDIRLTHFFRNAAWLLLLALCATQTQAQPSGPYDWPDETIVTHIVLKFHEGSGMRLRPGGLVRELRASLPPGVAEADLQADGKSIEALARAARLSLRRSFHGFSEKELDEHRARGEARSGIKLRDLNLYFDMELPAGTTYGTVRHIIERLKPLKSVEVAYAAPVPALTTHITPNFTANQGYLDSIEARYAWTLPGGRGAGVRVIDVEGGWRTTHEDFPSLFYSGGAAPPPPSTVNPQHDLDARRHHGTAAVGIVAAKNNSYGITGIAADALAGIQSFWTVAGGVNTANAIATAASNAGPGGVVLLEMQSQGPSILSTAECAQTCSGNQCNLVPQEFLQADFDAIRTWTAQGVVIVGAAGNGSANLDHPSYNRAFDRSFRDSGAIIVGASLSSSRTPACFTNYGSRIDVHSWGDSVYSMGYAGFDGFFGFDAGHGEDGFYVFSFGGTSSASAIVAGAASSVQGNRLAFSIAPLRSAEMRSVLASTGTPQTGNLARRIGPQPNLRQILIPPQATSVSLSASSPQIDPSQTVTLTATVSGLNPTGTVSFFDNGVLIGTISLVNGRATLTTAALGFGLHNFTATYGGGGGNLASSTAAATIVTSGNVGAIINIINSILLDD